MQIHRRNLERKSIQKVPLFPLAKRAYHVMELMQLRLVFAEVAKARPLGSFQLIPVTQEYYLQKKIMVDSSPDLTCRQYTMSPTLHSTHPPQTDQGPSVKEDLVHVANHQ